MPTILGAILDSIPEDQKSGLEGTLAKGVSGLMLTAGALEVVHGIKSAMGEQITMASEGASNAGIPSNISRGPRGLE